MKIESQDKIDNYLLNRMTDEERQTFELEVAKDKELKDQLLFTQHMQRAIKSRNEKLAVMKEWGDDYEWEKEAAAIIPSPKMKWVYWISGIAAVFIAGLLIINNQFFRPNIDPNGMLRGKASYAYIDTLIIHEDYQEALIQIDNEIQTLRNDSIESVQDSLMSNEAREYEMLLIKDRQDDLKWQTVMALLGMDRKDEALILLDELRREKGEYQKDAKALYKLVKRGK